MDWEFLEDGETIKPISVGMVREDGEELYYEFADAPWSDIVRHAWLKENVYPKLDCVKSGALVRGEGDTVFKGRLAIMNKIYNFLQEAWKLDRKNGIELWGWYSSYDHVCLAQLFGKMINLPGFVPMWTNDLRQEFYRLGDPSYPRQSEGLHNALEDAKHIKTKHEWLIKYEAENV
jgi:hypothetical protein